MKLYWQNVNQLDHMRLPPEPGFYAVRENSGGNAMAGRYMYWNTREFWSPQKETRITVANKPWFYKWYGWPHQWAHIDWDEFEWHHFATDPPTKNGPYWVLSNTGRYEIAYRTGYDYFVLSQDKHKNGWGFPPSQTSCYKWAEFTRSVQ